MLWTIPRSTELPIPTGSLGMTSAKRPAQIVEITPGPMLIPTPEDSPERTGERGSDSGGEVGCFGGTRGDGRGHLFMCGNGQQSAKEVRRLPEKGSKGWYLG